ncbi:MAG: hypothetical protein JWL77_6352 [Chthonomonadaceae bacterium]|nr:hypothetical protein [Chthonomonadaceae bacterium]
MNRETGLTGLVLVAMGLSSVPAKAQEGKGLWGVKPVPLETVLYKAHFQVLLPNAVPSGLTLHKAEITWVQNCHEVSRLHIPTRQMVCLFYKIQGRGSLALIEAKVLPGNAGESHQKIDPTDPYVYQAVGECYFFDEIKVGTRLSSGSINGVAFMIVGQSKEDIQALQDSLSSPGNRKSK